jgi:hypothetical protein
MRVSVDAFALNALCEEAHHLLQFRELVSRVRSSVSAIEEAAAVEEEPVVNVAESDIQEEHGQ